MHPAILHERLFLHYTIIKLVRFHLETIDRFQLLSINIVRLNRSEEANFLRSGLRHDLIQVLVLQVEHLNAASADLVVLEVMDTVAKGLSKVHHFRRSVHLKVDWCRLHVLFDQFLSELLAWRHNRVIFHVHVSWYFFFKEVRKLRREVLGLLPWHLDAVQVRVWDNSSVFIVLSELEATECVSVYITKRPRLELVGSVLDPLLHRADVLDVVESTRSSTDTAAGFILIHAGPQ